MGDLAGKTFRSVQIDSWEINIPNWSQTFLDDFRRFRGYDAGPYLAALSGHIVGSAEITDRFLHDYRKTLADCVAENYFGRFTDAGPRGKLLEPERGRRAVLPEDDAHGLPEKSRPLRHPDGRVLAGRNLGRQRPERQRQADGLGRAPLRQAIGRRRGVHFVPRNGWIRPPR